jgi:exopolysaccharide biosynthesis polyprenyl glycosylphosphotransferase
VNATGRVEALAPAASPHVRAHDLTEEVLRRRATKPYLRRGWLVRRALLTADLLAISGAFATTAWLSGSGDVGSAGEALAFVATLPLWVLLIKLHGLYDGDESYADHVTVDEVAGVFRVITAGTWGFALIGALVPDLTYSIQTLATFWVVALVLVLAGRGVARFLCRRSIAYVQNTIVVGTDPNGQLVARKLQKHPEYGLNLVGFVDSVPRPLRDDLDDVAVLGTLRELEYLVRELDVERVVVAHSHDSHEEQLQALRALRELAVQIDIVPRLYEAVGPRVGIHSVEGLPLVVLPPARLSPSSRLLKRTLDVVVASITLVLIAPVLGLIALLLRHDSPGKAIFRQKRLGQNMREFELLKFRTMRVDTDDRVHREYIRSTMSPEAKLGRNGLYKLDRDDAVTRVGRWLRRTSLDELPQLVNVLRGDMSLVGPRPCLAYETEHFEPHHFDRFLVPAGITGLWQVSARATSSFGEALDMDVAYARGWSLGLDLRLLFRTPLHVLRQRRTTA